MRFGAAACLAAVLLMSGCGPDVPDFPETAPVTGTVTHGGKPVEGATVQFHPAATGEGAYGATATSGPDGTYAVSTFFSPAATKEGAVPGEYSITVTKMPPVDPTTIPAHGDDYVERDVEPRAPVSLLPKQYSDPVTSPLKARVEAGQDNVVPLDLK